MKNRLNLASLSVQEQAAHFESQLEPEPNTGCWIWTGASNKLGYGIVSIGYRGRRTVGIHRLFYEAKNGPIPRGYDVTRSCGVRSCCNAIHLRLLTGLVAGAALKNLGATRCPRGHAHDIRFNNGKGTTARGCSRCRREANRRYRNRHPEYPKIRAAMFAVLGGPVCVRCGFSDPRALQVDHKNGGGRRHKELFSSNRSYGRYIAAHPDEFQVLCANCNWIKRAERDEMWRPTETRPQRIA